MRGLHELSMPPHLPSPPNGGEELERRNEETRMKFGIHNPSWLFGTDPGSLAEFSTP